MRNILFVSLVSILFILSPKVISQTMEKGFLRVIPYDLEQHGDLIYINMDFDVSNVIIDPDRSLTLTPLLVGEEIEFNLPEIIINGRRKHKAYKRDVVLAGKKINGYFEGPYEVIKANNREKRVINYTVSVPFEDWMKNARLDLKEELCGCGGKSQEIVVERLGSRILLEYIIPYEITPYVCYVKPEVEEIKNRSEQVNMFLDFPVAQTVILPAFGNNYRELAKIEDALREIIKDRNLLVNQIDIAGYASPEGSVALNNRLSEGRAGALRKYLADKSDFSSSIYRIKHGGEDWKTLAELVDNSNLYDKYDILQILENPYLTQEDKKLRLRSLNGGRTYQTLLNEFYPSLRRVTCEINYTIRGFSPEEGREIFKTHPHQLSMEEMFLVANTYAVGSKEFVEIFETAVKMYPEDNIANLNAAATALIQGNLVSAENYLKQSNSESAEYINNLGLLHLLQGEYGKAGKLLQEAEKRGLQEATFNLKEIENKLNESSNIERR